MLANGQIEELVFIRLRHADEDCGAILVSIIVEDLDHPGSSQQVNPLKLRSGVKKRTHGNF